MFQYKGPFCSNGFVRVSKNHIAYLRFRYHHSWITATTPSSEFFTLPFDTVVSSGFSGDERTPIVCNFFANPRKFPRRKAAKAYIIHFFHFSTQTHTKPPLLSLSIHRKKTILYICKYVHMYIRYKRRML